MASIYLSKSVDVLSEIQDARDKVEFLPILGFDVSSDPIYNLLPEDEDGVFNEIFTGKLPKQIIELCHANNRLVEVQNRCKADSILQRYINRYSNSIGYDHIDETVADTQDPVEGCLLAFLSNVIKFTYLLTIKWSGQIAAEPSPIGNSFNQQSVSILDCQLHIEEYNSIKRSLNCCAILWNLDQSGNKIDLLQIKWIYAKLLRLASEVCASEHLWENNPCETSCDGAVGVCTSLQQDTPIQIHSNFIARFSHASNWRQEGVRFIPNETPEGGAAIRLTHILWLQRLIRHLMICGKRAYRNREELAFLLSLNDQVCDLPDETVDPFEIGLLLPVSEDESNIKTLKEALKYCEGEARQSPQPFFWALARALNQDREAASDCVAASEQVILTMCLDREMERALIKEFSCFRMLIPVDVFVKNKKHPTWLLAECIRSDEAQPIGYVVNQWIGMGELIESFSLQYEGPLLIKLFGSPLERLPKDLKSVRNPGNWILGQATFRHRVVLDETALLSTLRTGLPPILGLKEFVEARRYFFFGQNAIRWSERLPYFMLRSDKTGNNNSSSMSKTSLAIGDSGVVGSNALAKLRISHTTKKAIPKIVINRFISRVAKQ